MWKVAFKIFVDFSIFGLIFTNLIIGNVLSSQSTDEILSSEEYIDLIYKSVLYNWIRILESFILLCLILKVSILTLATM
jgi:hypothetical protein